jgi:hypothetical protein
MKSITPFLNVPLSDAIFTVDTRDGLKADSSGYIQIGSGTVYDINIYKNQQLFSGAVQRVALTEINMPWVCPNVNEYNNVLYLTPEIGDEFEMTLSTGFYTPEELANAIESVLNGAVVFGSSSWVVSYNDNLPINIINFKSFKILNNDDKKFKINPKYGQSKGYGTNLDGSKVLRTDTLATMTGLAGNNPIIAPGATSQFSSTWIGGYASMLYTTYIDIVSSILCKNQNVRDTSTSNFTGQNILARIYIAPEGYTKTENEDGSSNILGTRPFHLHYNFPVPKEIQWNQDEFLPSCNIRIQDMFGNVLFNPNSLSVSYPADEPTNPASIFCGISNWVQLTMFISEAGVKTGDYTAFN